MYRTALDDLKNFLLDARGAFIQCGSRLRYQHGPANHTDRSQSRENRHPQVHASLPLHEGLPHGRPHQHRSANATPGRLRPPRADGKEIRATIHPFLPDRPTSPPASGKRLTPRMPVTRSSAISRPSTTQQEYTPAQEGAFRWNGCRDRCFNGSQNPIRAARASISVLNLSFASSLHNPLLKVA